MMITRTILPLAGATLLASCAQTGEEPPTYAGVDSSRQCFFTSQISGYGSAPDGPEGEERLVVSTGPSKDWLFQVRGPCPELDFSHQIGFDLRGRTTLCTGDIETLLVPSTIQGRFDRCQVRLLGQVIEEDEEEAPEG